MAAAAAGVVWFPLTIPGPFLHLCPVPLLSEWRNMNLMTCLLQYNVSSVKHEGCVPIPLDPTGAWNIGRGVVLRNLSCSG